MSEIYTHLTVDICTQPSVIKWLREPRKENTQRWLFLTDGVYSHQASDIRIATESAIWARLLKLLRGRPGYVEQGEHNKHNREKTKKNLRRPLNITCHLLGGNAPSKALILLVSLQVTPAPLSSLRSDSWSHKTNIQSDFMVFFLNTLFTYIRYVLK